MNIMLVSVAERVREIGLRKALGATPSVILRQFLLEASLLGLTGGMLGLAVGYAGAAVLPNLLSQPVTISAVVRGGRPRGVPGDRPGRRRLPGPAGRPPRPHRRPPQRMTKVNPTAMSITMFRLPRPSSVPRSVPSRMRGSLC